MFASKIAVRINKSRLTNGGYQVITEYYPKSNLVKSETVTLKGKIVEQNTYYEGKDSQLSSSWFVDEFGWATDVWFDGFGEIVSTPLFENTRKAGDPAYFADPYKFFKSNKKQ